MGYRDETDGLRVRVADLEVELAEAREKIARLTGEGPRIDTGDVVEESSLLGVPKRVVCERILDLEIDDAAFERIAEAVRPRLPKGREPTRVAQVGRTLHAPGFFLESRNGRTHVRMEGDYRAASAASLSISGLGGAFLAMIAFAIAHDGFFRGMSEGHILWMLPLAAFVLFPLVRSRMSASVRKQQVELRATFETVLEIARTSAIPAGAAKAAGVAAPDAANAAGPASARDAAAEVEAEAEAEAEADAASTGRDAEATAAR